MTRNHFVKFVEAVEWVEREIVELANETDVKKEGRILSDEEIKAIGIKVEFCNGLKQKKSFADNMDTKKSRQAT